MSLTRHQSNSIFLGIGYLVLALVIWSLQNVAVKWIGGDYSVLQIVTLRSLVALPSTLVLYRLEGGRGLPRTHQHKLEAVRGMLLFLSYTTHMMGLTALPLADVESLRFSGPLMITCLSVVMLGEKVEARRWLALFVGLAGVLLIVQPGGARFNLGSIMILTSVLFYALNIMMTRKLQATDSSATMAFYSSLVYMAIAMIAAPVALAIGEPTSAHPSVAFLLRPWAMPSLADAAIMLGLGLIWSGGMYCMTRAYSLALASVAAPFEYVSLPINVVWGLIFWQEMPAWTTLAGAALTLASGLYVLCRERQVKPASTTAAITT